MGINLTKGEKINLSKEDGSVLTRVFMGLGWDPIKRGGFLGLGSTSENIDLDASVVMMNENNQEVDVVWFGHLRSNDGSIVHSGDNLTGYGDGDDETIMVDLTRVPSNVAKLVFTINSFRGQTFERVENCFSRLVDDVTKKEIFIYKLAETGPHTAKIMCMLYRHNGGWKAWALGTAANAQTVRDLLPQIRQAI